MPPTRPLLTCVALLFASAAAAELRITAPGAPAAVLDNVRAHLSLAGESCDAPPWRVQREFRRIDQEIQPALRAFGYYSAELTKTLTRDDQCWHADLTLTLGAPVLVRRLDLEISGDASDDPAFSALQQALPLRVGEALHHGRYEEIKSRLRNLALEHGYFDAELRRHELRVDPGAGAADIDLHFASGTRYRFGELQLGEQPLYEPLVRRLAHLQPGTPYSARELAALNRYLSDAGYYRRVEVRPRHDLAQDQAIPIEVQFEPLPRHAWRAGIGYATDTGPRLSLGYANRYLNRRGHRLDNELRLSPVESGLTSEYVIPGRDPHRETFNFSAGLLREDTDTSLSDSAKLAARQTLKHDTWTETRFIELLHERSTIGTDDTSATLLMPGIGWTRVTVDDPLRTRRGYRLNFEVRGAYEGLLSTVSLLQLRAGAKGIHRFGNAGRVTGRADLGTTLGGDFFDLPASLRFFAGGDNSVRGYAYKSLSPQDADGEEVGARHLIAASLEYEHPVVGEDWWAAAFVDAGNAFDSRDFELKYGYGVGVRWYSPVGRLRVDIAIPSDTAADSWRLHFGLGVDL